MDKTMQKLASKLFVLANKYLKEYNKSIGVEDEIVWIENTAGEVILFASSMKAIKKHSQFLTTEGRT